MNQLQLFQKSVGLTPDGVIGPKTLRAIKSNFRISNNAQVANFVANLVHETGNFVKEYENLNYSAKRMLEIFKSDFDTNRDKWLSPKEKEKVHELVGRPDRIANFVYANQGGNGPESSGDGWKFRGRGPLQLTLRGNYVKFSSYVNYDCVADPDAVVTKYYWLSAIWFFNENRLWTLASSVDTKSITTLRRRINGGTNGLAEVIELTNKFYKMINS